MSGHQQARSDVPRPAFATVADFCRLSGVGRTSLYDALKSGHVPARKLGARTLIDVAAGLAWIESLPAYK